jgi:hypothetical protein
MSTEPTFVPPRLRFDATITAGNLLTVLAGLVAMTGAYVDYRLTMDRHEVRIANVEAAQTQMRQEITDSAKVQQEMVRAIDRLTYQLQSSKQ